MVLINGPTGWQFLKSEVPLYSYHGGAHLLPLHQSEPLAAGILVTVGGAACEAH